MSATKYDAGKPQVHLLDSAVVKTVFFASDLVPRNARPTYLITHDVLALSDSIPKRKTPAATRRTVAKRAISVLRSLRNSGSGARWEDVADVLAFGAKKYAAHNWREGLAWSRFVSAAWRHLEAVRKSELRDEESCLYHAAHAACNLMFLAASAMHGYGTDDLYHPEPKKKASDS